MADLDAELGSRLARLAESVPVAPWLGHVEPSPVAARRRIRMAWVTPLVAIAVVALASALFDLSIEPLPGATKRPSPLAPSSLPNGVVHASATDGAFLLEIESPRRTYLNGEPIDVRARLTYLGQGRMFDIGISMAGRPIKFGIVEPIHGLELRPDARMSCNATVMTAGRPLEAPFKKSGGFDETDPRAAEWQAFFAEPALFLPVGTWHPYVEASFALGDGCNGPEAVNLRVEIEIEVVDAPPTETPAPASPAPADTPVVGTDSQGPYAIELSADRRVYRASDAIDITSAFTYSGSVPQRVADVRGPALSIVEPVYGMKLRTWLMGDLVCPASRQLQPAERIEQGFVKQADVATTDTEYESKRAYLEDPVLRLPPGTWHVRATAGVLESCGSEGIGLSAEVEILVLPDDPEASPPQLHGDLGSIDTDGTFVLELSSGGTTWRAGEPIGLAASYWYAGSEEAVTVHHFDPELGFTITQLDVDGRVVRAMVYDSTCTERLLSAGVRRSLSPFRYYTTRIVAASWPHTTAEALDNGVLQLPAGRWRITVSLATAIGPCSATGAEHQLVAEAELTVVPDSGPGPTLTFP